jgi:hypothetical protein
LDGLLLLPPKGSLETPELLPGEPYLSPLLYVLLEGFANGSLVVEDGLLVLPELFVLLLPLGLSNGFIPILDIFYTPSD